MTDDEIKDMWKQANERITEVLLLATALQTLLQEAGLFSKAAVDARVDDLRTSFQANLQRHLEEWRDQQSREERRRLLESFEGTKQ